MSSAEACHNKLLRFERPHRLHHPIRHVRLPLETSKGQHAYYDGDLGILHPPPYESNVPADGL